MDADDIVAEIRMERQAFKGAFVLVEGTTDVRRFEQFLDSFGTSLVNCWGKSKLIIAAKKLNGASVSGFVGLSDADFDRVTEKLEAVENILYSENHDFDIDAIRTPVFGRYLKEVADITLCDQIGDADSIRHKIAESLVPISAAKLANERALINYKLSETNWLPALKDFQMNKEQLAFIILKKDNPNREAIEALVKVIDGELPLDLWQTINGHDFASALGACLRREIAERKHHQTVADEVERHIRLALSESDFKSMHIFSSLAEWQDEKGLPVLKSQLLN